MKISCLGDSVTEGFGVGAEENWVSLLSIRSDHNFLNDGVMGDTLTGMLSRLDSQILQKKPDAVIVLGGWNDLLICKNMDTAKSAMMAIVHHCARAGVMPVVVIPYAIQSVPERRKAVCKEEADFEEYIDWLKKFCRTFYLRCVDISAIGEKENLLADGLHPNVRGHRIIADAVMDSGWFREDGRRI